jgi:hypothetical protein
MSSLSSRAPTHYGWGHGAQGCNSESFPYRNKYIHIYIYILKCVLSHFMGQNKEEKQKSDRADGPKTRAWPPSQTQSHEPAPEASASCKRFKMRSTTGRSSRVDFGSCGMSWMGSRPRSTRMLEIITTCYDSCLASVAHSPLILATCARALTNSADRSCLSLECRPRSSSSTSIASHTSKSISCRQRRIWLSSSVRPRSVSYSDRDLEAHA